jgi:predicted RNA-binding Zn-ribbon protein involved in translation (DUF1610 family)
MQDTPPVQKISKDKVHRYRCASCGADLVFEPKDGALTCPYCKHSESIPQTAEQVAEQSFDEYLKLRPEQFQPFPEATQEVDCESCGALVTFAPPEVAQTCSFCGAPIVAQPKTPDPMLCPEGVLPFTVEKTKATTALREWIASRWFAPNALKQFAVPGALQGVYIPYWTYDAHTTSHYTGQRGEWYYVTEQYTTQDSQGNQQVMTRQVRHTRWYFSSGMVQRWFDDILVPATTSLNENRLLALEPWDLPELKSYDPAYLAGFKAQRYQVDLPAGFERAKKLAEPTIASDVRRDIGGDEQIITQIQTHYSGITFKHILLPIYVGAYRFEQKLYQIVVNGRTGEVQGERPYSVIKITLFLLMILSIIIAIVYYFEHHAS